MPHREPFDPKRQLVAAREFRFAGIKYGPGDPFPGPDAAGIAHFSRRNIERQYSAHAVNHVAEAAEEDKPVKMVAGPQNGRYTITAPWLDKPLVVRGKKNADDTFAEMTEAGAPLGWIEGGTETGIEESGGGWYQITAPWLDEPEKVQGREAASARQLEIHSAGAPETNDDNAGEGGEGGDQGDQTGTEGAPPPADGEQGADANSANAGTADGDATGAVEQGGSDGPEKAEGAESGAQAETEAEAGKSEDKPADA